MGSYLSSTSPTPTADMSEQKYRNPDNYTYPSPLAPYEGKDLPPLTEERDVDGYSIRNPPAPKSEAYTKFVYPLDNGRRGGL